MADLHRLFQGVAAVPGITARMVQVTPDFAKALLETNTHNRKISAGTVDRYVREIDNGEWYAVPAGVGVDDHGVLVDGQQRLTAVVKSGKTVPLLVVMGLPTMAQEKCDRQRKRTMFDVMVLAGVETNRKAVQIATFLAKRVSQAFTAPADSDVKACLRSHSTAIYRSLKLAPSGGRYGSRGAGMYGAFVLAIEMWPEKAEEFVEKFHEPSGLANDDPRWKLNRWTLQPKTTTGGRDTQQREFGVTAGCVNAYFAGKKMLSVREEKEIIVPPNMKLAI